MLVILYKMLLISFILLYSLLIIGLWPVSFLCGFLLACKYSMHCLMFESRACTLVQSTRSPTSVAARSSSTISGETARLSTYDFGTMESQMAWTDSLVILHPYEYCTAGRRLSASAFALFFPGLYLMSKLKVDKAANYL